MNPLVQISEVSVKVCFVGRPRQSIHPGGGIAFEREERHPQAVDADVVEECSEPLLLPLPCACRTRSSACAKRSRPCTASAPRIGIFRGSMAGLCAPPV